MTSVVDSVASPPCSAPDAQSVAYYFANMYYKLLVASLAYAYQFYEGLSDYSSVVSWPGWDGKSVVTVTTIEKIKDLIMSKDYQGCQALVETIHGQPSQSGGVIVQVTGTWIAKETSKSFCETYFLANTSRGSYYVLNDIFRFIDRKPPAVASSQLMGIRWISRVLKEWSRSWSLFRTRFIMQPSKLS